VREILALRLVERVKAPLNPVPPAANRQCEGGLRPFFRVARATRPTTFLADSSSLIQYHPQDITNSDVLRAVRDSDLAVLNNRRS
jgi:hypothetical protein